MINMILIFDNKYIIFILIILIIINIKLKINKRLLHKNLKKFIKCDKNITKFIDSHILKV